MPGASAALLETLTMRTRVLEGLEAAVEERSGRRQFVRRNEPRWLVCHWDSNPLGVSLKGTAMI